MATGAMRYFEDLEIGEEVITPGRTLTEADLVNFVGLSGDFSSISTDQTYAESTEFGQRVIPGVLGVAIADGLKNRTALAYDVHGIASLGWTWEVKRPLFIGDTVRARFVIEGKRETSKPDRGVVFYRVQLLDRHGNVVHEGQHRRMVRRRPTNPQ